MATGDKKRAIMTDDINNSGSSYPVLGPTGDGSNVTAAFTAAGSRTNISTGEKLSVICGKIAKWFTDLGTAAFTTLDTSSLTDDNVHVPTSGVVKSAITGVENNIANNHQTSPTCSMTESPYRIPAGDYFYLDDVLVRAKTPIANGERFTLNTNYEVESAGAINSCGVKMSTKTLTTNASGAITGSVSDLFDGVGGRSRLLSVYFERGTYSVNRSVDIAMYGNAGYMLVFYDNGSPVVSSSVTYTAIYI